MVLPNVDCVPVVMAGDTTSDAELVTAARSKGSSRDDAFRTLVQRYQPMVYAVALSLVRPADADDVAQDAFLRAFQNLDLLADPSRFGVWLRRITFGVAIDHGRADRTRTRHLDDQFDFVDATDPDLDPLSRVEQNEIASRVLAALDRMPARYRVPLTLYHIDGLSHAKIARTLGVPDATVRSIVARARRRLTRILGTSPEVQDMAKLSPNVRDSIDILDESVAEIPRLLHVLNGDSVRMTLEQSQVPGTFAPYADVLHEGPVPFSSGTLATRETRVRWVAANGYIPYADGMRMATQWDEQLASFADYDEVVMWFEHDLFDQLLLVRHLDWFSRQEMGRTKLSLICIGEFPGFEPFHGLGQLDEVQLASLLGTREPVSAEQFALGRQVWAAFTSPDPIALNEAANDTGPSVLPFLPGALQRFMDDYPSTGNGLPRTERHTLELLLASGGESSIGGLFLALQKREERVYMGDTTFWRRVRELAAGPVPLVRIAGDASEPPHGRAEMTEAGRAVLAGDADWITLNGFDRWFGGVRLQAPVGGDVAWRYDRATRTVVARA
jgi:RNA polymerase sigma factor (sigma-70 family)